jgi:hypothetical protein
MVRGVNREPETLGAIRKLLLVALCIGVLGTIAELVLLRHIDEVAQWLPVGALTAAIPILIWHGASPGNASVRTLQSLMVVFIILGVAGVGLHYNGNLEFERELHPAEHGWEFLRKTVAGATPVLAPGSMVLLGLIGLAHAYRHPSIDGGGHRQETFV